MSDIPLSRKELSELRRLAATEGGKQLIAYLRQNESRKLQAAMSQAAAGNYDQARQLAKELMASPEVQKFLKQMGR